MYNREWCRRCTVDQRRVRVGYGTRPAGLPEVLHHRQCRKRYVSLEKKSQKKKKKKKKKIVEKKFSRKNIIAVQKEVRFIGKEITKKNCRKKNQTKQYLVRKKI